MAIPPEEFSLILWSRLFRVNVTVNGWPCHLTEVTTKSQIPSRVIILRSQMIFNSINAKTKECFRIHWSYFSLPV